MKNSRSIGTMVLAGAGSGLGGYIIGNQANAKRTTPAASAIQSYAVLFPAAIGALGWLLLRKKNPAAAEGLLYGGIAGAGWGYYQFGKAAAPAAGVASNTAAAGGTGATGASPSANGNTAGSPSNAGMTAGTSRTAAGANTPANYGTAATATSRMIGRGRRGARRMGGPLLPRPAAAGVLRALNSPFGSGLSRHVGDMILPRRFKTGSSAFGRDAWTR